MTSGQKAGLGYATSPRSRAAATRAAVTLRKETWVKLRLLYAEYMLASDGMGDWGDFVEGMVRLLERCGGVEQLVKIRREAAGQ